MSYRIYPLKDQSRLKELCTLFAKGLADTTPEYWKWKHFSENGQPEGMILVAETEDGSMAGMFALQPEVYRWGNAEIVVVQTEDLVIDPGHRGSGLMRLLYQHAKKHYSDMGYWGFNAFANENSYPIFMKYGAKDMGDIDSVETGKRILPIYFCRKKRQVGDWKIELEENMPEDLFCPECRDGFQMEKTKAFMAWKFGQNPEKDFLWLTIRKNGALQGYLTVCITRGRLRRAVNIYDWSLKDTVDASVLKCAVELLLTHGNWVELWGRYREDDRRLWAEAGLDRKSARSTHFLLMPFREGEIPDHWHLTRADLDY